MGADEQLDWLLAVDSKLDGINKFITGLDKAEGKLKGQQHHIGAVESELGKLDTKLGTIDFDKIAKGFKTGNFEGIFTATAGAELFAKGLETVLEIGAKVAEKVIDIGKEAILAAAKSERMDIPFKLILGKEQGEEVLAFLEHVQKNSAYSTTELKGFATSLVGIGFKGKELEKILPAALDIGEFMGGGAGGVETAIGVFDRIKASGEISAKMFTKLGLNAQTFYKDLGSQYGIDSAESLKKSLHKGAIDSSTIIATLLKEVAAKEGGAVGNIAAEAGKTVDASLHKLSTLPEKYFEHIAKTSGFGGLGDLLDRVVTLLDPESPTGKKIQESIDSIFNKLLGALGLLGTDENLNTFGDKMVQVFDWIDKTGVPAVLRFVDVIGKLLKFLGDLVSVGSKITDFMPSFSSAMNGLGAAFAPGLVGPGPREKATTSGDFLDQFREDTEGRVLNGGRDMALRLKQGFAEGLLNYSDISGEIAKFPESVQTEMKDTLGIHSPSRVFAELGAMSAQGFYDGMNSTLSSDGLDIPTPTLSGGATMGGATINVSVNVDAQGANADDAQAIAEKIAEVMPTTLQSAFEQLGLELGAG